MGKAGLGRWQEWMLEQLPELRGRKLTLWQVRERSRKGNSERRGRVCSCRDWWAIPKSPAFLGHPLDCLSEANSRMVFWTLRSSWGRPVLLWLAEPASHAFKHSPGPGHSLASWWPMTNLFKKQNKTRWQTFKELGRMQAKEPRPWTPVTGLLSWLLFRGDFVERW